jgi:hypothetical protein
VLGVGLSSGERIADFRDHLIEREVLPETDDCPTSCLEFSVVAGIALNVAFELSLPPGGVGFRCGSMLGASVPEASVHEDRHASATKDDVCAAAHRGNRALVLSKPQSSSV